MFKYSRPPPTGPLETNDNIYSSTFISFNHLELLAALPLPSHLLWCLASWPPSFLDVVPAAANGGEGGKKGPTIMTMYSYGVFVCARELACVRFPPQIWGVP